MEFAMQDITKLCADHLRAFSENYGVKLKASHAHELVAAFFGYKSRAALLADTQYPLSNLPLANVIVLAPTAPIDQRCKDLHKDIPPKFPDSYSLGEVIYTVLLAEKWLISTPWSTYEQLAAHLADNYISQNSIKKFYRAPIGENIKIEYKNDSICLTVLRFYQVLTEKILLDGVISETNITTTIWLKRIAGHIGYGKPQISVELWMDGARKTLSSLV